MSYLAFGAETPLRIHIPQSLFFGMPPALSLTVGAAGEGKLSVKGGASAALNGRIIVGDTADGIGEVTVHGSESSILSSHSGGQHVDEVVVGASGVGTFALTGGARGYFGDSAVIIGQNLGSSGTLSVDGPLSQLSAGTIDVGPGGTGVFRIWYVATRGQ